MDKLKIECLYPTTVSSVDGKRFHPAVSKTNGIVERPQYWPNITVDTEDEAFEIAKQFIADANKAAQSVTDSWDICQL